mmetsp:Transcript_43641/g.113748  ORF Transcript_43641/g.113748 Transcript_43641/m.113748 type:complete len:307 (-) Transcript_43641:476-1396(-)
MCTSARAAHFRRVSTSLSAICDRSSFPSWPSSSLSSSLSSPLSCGTSPNDLSLDVDEGIRTTASTFSLSSLFSSSSTLCSSSSSLGSSSVLRSSPPFSSVCACPSSPPPTSLSPSSSSSSSLILRLLFTVAVLSSTIILDVGECSSLISTARAILYFFGATYTSNRRSSLSSNRISPSPDVAVLPYTCLFRTSLSISTAADADLFFVSTLHIPLSRFRLYLHISLELKSHACSSSSPLNMNRSKVCLMDSSSLLMLHTTSHRPPPSPLRPSSSLPLPLFRVGDGRGRASNEYIVRTTPSDSLLLAQ